MSNLSCFLPQMGQEPPKDGEYISPIQHIPQTELLELLFSNTCDKIDVETLEALVEGWKEEMNRNKLFRQYLVRQLPEGRWCARIDGKAVRKTKLADLEKLLRDHDAKKDLTINTMYNDFMKARKNMTASTTWGKDIYYYETFIRNSPIADIPLDKLYLSQGYEFFEHCLSIKPNIKKHYWNNVWGTLSQMIQFALSSGYIQNNPFTNLRINQNRFTPATVTKDADSIFSWDEQKAVCALAEADSADKNNAVPLGIVLLFNLGLRIGELCALKWMDIEEIHGKQYIHIQREITVHLNDEGKKAGYMVLNHTKTPAGDRQLLLNSKCLELFDRIKKLNEQTGYPTEDEDFIFMKVYKGVRNYCTDRSFTPRLYKYCNKAGMNVKKSPHDIRRTTLTNLYHNGMPLKAIQHYAGHSSLKQTMDYIRVREDDDILPYLESLCTSDENVIPFPALEEKDKRCAL